MATNTLLQGERRIFPRALAPVRQLAGPTIIPAMKQAAARWQHRFRAPTVMIRIQAPVRVRQDISPQTAAMATSTITATVSWMSSLQAQSVEVVLIFQKYQSVPIP